MLLQLVADRFDNISVEIIVINLGRAQQHRQIVVATQQGEEPGLQHRGLAYARLAVERDEQVVFDHRQQGERDVAASAEYIATFDNVFFGIRDEAFPEISLLIHD